MHRFTDATLPDLGRLTRGLQADLGALWSPDFNLYGVRSPSRRAGPFDDACVVCVPPGSRLIGSAPGLVTRPIFRVFPFTTDPGRHWLAEPMRREGCAVLVPGHYPDFWAPGLHQGRYRALCQVGPGVVWRDADRDDSVDPPTDRTWPAQGINLHHAGGATVNTWASAGCQVTPEADDLAAILWFTDLRARILSLVRVSYTLREADKLPDAGEILRLAARGMT